VCPERLASIDAIRHDRRVMSLPEVFGEDDEPIPQGEPEPWRPPVSCPNCQNGETRFVTLRYEMSVYVCEICGVEFEVEE